jgi:hypothetical protein
MINYEIANKIVACIPDECKACFWRTFDLAKEGDGEAIRTFQIFIAIYNKQ